MRKNIRKKREETKKMENKKRYSSDELNETDNPIKKYKVDVATTLDNHLKTEHHKIDTTEKELNKFLLIFNLLLEANEKKDSGEVTDAEGGIPDILMLITRKLLELLQQNIDSLNIPNILKKALKKLKEPIFKQKMTRKRFLAAAKRHYLLRANPARAAVAAAAARAQAVTAAPSAAAATAAVTPVAKSAPIGRRGRRRRQVAGVKNIEGRVRNKRFKIKRLLPQPRNTEVKKKGVVVRRMVVRRETIFPAEVRRAYY